MSTPRNKLPHKPPPPPDFSGATGGASGYDDRDYRWHPGRPVTPLNAARDVAETVVDSATNPADAGPRAARRVGSYFGHGGPGFDINTPVEEDPAIAQMRRRAGPHGFPHAMTVDEVPNPDFKQYLPLRRKRRMELKKPN